MTCIPAVSGAFCAPVGRQWFHPHPGSGCCLSPRLPGDGGYQSHCDGALSVRPHREWQGVATHRHAGQEMASPLICHGTFSSWVFLSPGLGVLCCEMGEA